MAPPTNWGKSGGTTTSWGGSETDTGISGAQVDTSYTSYSDYRVYDNKRIFFGDDDDFSIVLNTSNSDLEIRDLSGDAIVSINNITGFSATLDGGTY